MVARFNNPYINKIYEFHGIVYQTDKLVEYVRSNPKVHIDFGCGNGELLEHLAKQNPDILYVGTDLQYKELFRAAKRIQKANLKNVVLCRERSESLLSLLEKDVLNSASIYFPDPWPKPKHARNRLFQTKFIENLIRTIRYHGHIYIKTDSDTYFREILQRIYSQNQLKIIHLSQDARNYPSKHELQAPPSSFERIFLKQNKLINSLVLQVTKA